MPEKHAYFAEFCICYRSKNRGADKNPDKNQKYQEHA